MVPRTVIVLLFIAAFMVTYWQYYRIDAKRRVLNLRFAMMVSALAGAIGYNFINHFYPDDRHISWFFLALALFWLATAYHLLRRMPVRRE
jgi:hypothetical protein